MWWGCLDYFNFFMLVPYNLMQSSLQTPMVRTIVEQTPLALKQRFQNNRYVKRASITGNFIELLLITDELYPVMLHYFIGRTLRKSARPEEKFLSSSRSPSSSRSVPRLASSLFNASLSASCLLASASSHLATRPPGPPDLQKSFHSPTT